MIRTKRRLLLGLSLAVLGTAGAQTLTGTWQGRIDLPETPLAIGLTFVDGADGLGGTIDIPAQGVDDLPLTSVTLNDETIQELLEVTNTTNMTQAVSTAVNEYLRRRRLERFRALRGKVDITSNDEIEAAELGELEQGG